jgi:peptidyl-prolyl cis-trans isomerase B (cyclophilin B)
MSLDEFAIYVKEEKLIKFIAKIVLASICTAFASFPSYAQETCAFIEPMSPMAFERDKSYYAVIHTTKGEIKCLLYPEKAPISVTNFIQLATGNFYNGLMFHRVISDYVIQGGDPERSGRSGLGYTLPAEIGLKHELGSLALARLPDHVNPNRRSSGSQFYITLDQISFLDGEDTVFGQTIEGLDVIKEIKEGDRIDRIVIEVQKDSE